MPGKQKVPGSYPRVTALISNLASHGLFGGGGGGGGRHVSLPLTMITPRVGFLPSKLMSC